LAGLGFRKPQRFGARIVSTLLIARSRSPIEARIDAGSAPADRLGTSGAQARRRVEDFFQRFLQRFFNAPCEASCEPGGTAMLDVLLVVVTIGFFAITLAYTAACGRL
jgi:hypothetical protein